MELSENNNEVNKPPKKLSEKTVKKCFMFILAALILEIFVFNM